MVCDTYKKVCEHLLKKIQAKTAIIAWTELSAPDSFLTIDKIDAVQVLAMEIVRVAKNSKTPGSFVMSKA